MTYVLRSEACPRSQMPVLSLRQRGSKGRVHQRLVCALSLSDQPPERDKDLARKAREPRERYLVGVRAGRSVILRRK